MSILSMLGLTGRGEEPILSPESFTKEFISVMQKADPARKLTTTKALEVITSKIDGQQQSISLGNCYDAYKLSPKDKDAIITRYVESYKNAVPTTAINTARIVPVIRNKGWLEKSFQNMRALNVDAQLYPYYESYLDDMIILYAEDTPTNMRILVQKDIDALNIKKEDLRSVCSKNLKNVLPSVKKGNVSGIYLISAGDNYESSLILLDEFWSGHTIEADGDYVVAIPARNILLITSSNNKAAIALLRTIAGQRFKESPYKITDKLLIYKNGSFSEYQDKN